MSSISDVSFWRYLPRHGHRVRVIRGKRVPVGTEGMVFWLDEPTYPTRIGIALNSVKDERGRFINVVWVPALFVEHA